ncbi:MAG: hypothetical protein K6U80_19505 [Firmicutes bacterium]|nr:hypothetical protein [Bacillota bacterium]
MMKRTIVLLMIAFVVITAFLITYYFMNKSGNIKQNTTNGYQTDIEPIRNRFPKLCGIKQVFWKAGLISKTNNVPGPSSYWMKGFIVLNKEEYVKLAREYKWTMVESSWKPDLNSTILGKNIYRWSFSNDFNEYIKPSSFFGKFYLDLENGIIFFNVEK